MRIYQIDAFTEEPFTGNPAGVVPDARGLSAAQMQSIAREMNCSETAFVGEDMHLRYFTPRQEVDLCGHATIASLHLLHELGGLPADCARRARTGAGVIEVGLRAGIPYMVQAEPRFRDCPADPGAMLGLSAADRDGPAVLAYTGLWHVLVPVRSVSALGHLEPDLARLARHNDALGCATTHIFALDGCPPGYDAAARDFAPAVGVAEDPQTGTASGAMGAWLVHSGRLGRRTLRVLQGRELGRPGTVHVCVQGSRVEVGGPAVTVLEADLRAAP